MAVSCFLLYQLTLCGIQDSLPVHAQRCVLGTSPFWSSGLCRRTESLAFCTGIQLTPTMPQVREHMGMGRGLDCSFSPEIHELVVVNRHIVSVVSLPDWRQESLREAEDPSPKIQPEAQSPNTELRLLRLNSTPEL